MERANTDDDLQSLQLVFPALSLFLGEVLPSKFEDIKNVNVYAADRGDDWEAHLKDQGKAWIITQLRYCSSGKRITRKASGGGTWDARTKSLKKHGDTCWYERKYKLVERAGLRKYTMMEYSPDEKKPKYALCRITVDNNKSAHDRPPSSSHQAEIMEIDHTDANNSDRGAQEIDHTDANNSDRGAREIDDTDATDVPTIEL